MSSAIYITLYIVLTMERDEQYGNIDESNEHGMHHSKQLNYQMRNSPRKAKHKYLQSPLLNVDHPRRGRVPPLHKSFKKSSNSIPNEDLILNQLSRDSIYIQQNDEQQQEDLQSTYTQTQSHAYNEIDDTQWMGTLKNQQNSTNTHYPPPPPTPPSHTISAEVDPIKTMTRHYTFGQGLSTTFNEDRMNNNNSKDIGNNNGKGIHELFSEEFVSQLQQEVENESEAYSRYSAASSRKPSPATSMLSNSKYSTSDDQNKSEDIMHFQNINAQKLYQGKNIQITKRQANLIQQEIQWDGVIRKLIGNASQTNHNTIGNTNTNTNNTNTNANGNSNVNSQTQHTINTKNRMQINVVDWEQEDIDQQQTPKMGNMQLQPIQFKSKSNDYEAPHADRFSQQQQQPKQSQIMSPIKFFKSQSNIESRTVNQTPIKQSQDYLPFGKSLQLITHAIPQLPAPFQRIYQGISFNLVKQQVHLQQILSKQQQEIQAWRILLTTLKLQLDAQSYLAGADDNQTIIRSLIRQL